ncbi:MAG: hypothetical protein ACE366_00255 [Bradymonadia bacterium]
MGEDDQEEATVIEEMGVAEDVEGYIDNLEWYDWTAISVAGVVLLYSLVKSSSFDVIVVRGGVLVGLTCLVLTRWTDNSIFNWAYIYLGVSLFMWIFRPVLGQFVSNTPNRL